MVNNIGEFEFSADDIRSAISEPSFKAIPFRSCEEYYTSFYKRSQELAENGDEGRSSACAFLSLVSNFHLKPREEHHPLVPRYDNSCALDHISSLQLDAIQSVVSEVEDADLRARLADILWILRRHYPSACVAASAYLAAGRDILQSTRAIYGFDRIIRSLQIGAEIGRDKQEFKTVSEYVSNLARNELASSADVATALDCIYEFRIGQPVDFAEIATKHASSDAAIRNPIWVRRFWGLASQFHARNNDRATARAAQIEVAKSFENEALHHVNGENPLRYHLGATLLEKAIRTYRNISNTEVERERIHQILVEWQAKSAGAIPTIKYSETNISDLIEMSIRLVAKKDFAESIKILVTAVRLPDVDHLRNDAQESLLEHPLANLFPVVKLGTAGKVVARETKKSNRNRSTSEIKEHTVMLQTFDIQKQLVTRGQINPIRHQILLEHRIRYEELMPLCSNNPFIPPNREALYIYGLYEGFHGNFVAALHVLVPQLESSIRWCLSNNGVVTSSLDNDGIQKELDLNTLLYHERIGDIFDDSTVFCLRVLLVDSMGSNFRNQIAHGMLDYAAFWGDTAMYIWWLILRLCWIGSVNGVSTPPPIQDTKPTEVESPDCPIASDDST